MEPAKTASLLIRQAFLIRRPHLLGGLISFGAYTIILLVTNVNILDSAVAVQRNVYQIHSLDILVPLPRLRWNGLGK